MELTRVQRDELERMIGHQHEEFLAGIQEDVARSRDESYGAIAGPVTDLVDEAAADLLSDLDYAEVSRDLREIRALEAAQARLADGSYGVCADCGSEIAFARLRAYPTAERCVECQRIHERTHADTGEPKL